MYNYQYAYEKMKDAVDVLAISPDKITKRLESAYITFSPVNEDDFPDDLKPDYRWMMDKLTKKEPVMDEGRVRATLLGMHTKTGVKIAKKIVFMRNRLEEYIIRQS